MCKFNGFNHFLFRDFITFTFNHDDIMFGTGNQKIHRSPFQVTQVWIDN